MCFMFKNKLFFLTLISTLTASAPSGELPEDVQAEGYRNHYFLFGSLSPVYGGGVSIRNRHCNRGHAVDFKMGFATLSLFDGSGSFPVVSADYNFLYYSQKETVSSYFSWGLGVAYLAPYVPLRVGYQGKYGFVDVGGKLVLGFVPVPEARAGVSLNF